MSNTSMDLHIHTDSSDGSLSVKELLQKAEDEQMSYISITDHNTVSAYDKIKEYRSVFSGKIITGVELSTTYKGELIEILGYGIDLPVIRRFISDNYLSFTEKTLKERLLILEQYKKIGVVMSDEFCYNMEHNPTMYYKPDREACRPPFLKEIKKHPENAVFFGGKQQMEETNIRTFFRNHYGRPSSMLYIDTASLFPSFDDVLSVIHKAGGFAFLAHGFLYSDNVTNDIEKIAINYSLDGFECYHSLFTKEQSEYMLKLCDKNNMYKSGGSDFHGKDRPEGVLGKATEGLPLNTSLINDWLKGINYYV